MPCRYDVRVRNHLPATLSKLSARRRIIAQDFMLPEKTKYSIFLPDLVLSGLLPEGFPPWKRNVQLESLKWLGASTQRFSENATCSGCIVHAENQLLHSQEVCDSRHLSAWVGAVLQTCTDCEVERSGLFLEVAVPLLRNVAFRGAEADLMLFLEALRQEFELVLATVSIRGCYFKHEVVQQINEFETVRLPRAARCTSARVMKQHPVLFGGIVYASAFALAFLRLQWVDKKTRVLQKIGVVPEFRGSIPVVSHL